MLYVSNAIGLYFPYDFCLYNDMPALVSHSLRYLPLLTAILVTPVVLFIRWDNSQMAGYGVSDGEELETDITA